MYGPRRVHQWIAHDQLFVLVFHLLVLLLLTLVLVLLSAFVMVNR